MIAASRSRRPPQAEPAAVFTPRTLAFLRALERNNRREWFHERKDRYEADVRAPMVALVERLAADIRGFAPDLMANPRTSIYRPYRDTRFASNKAPLKTNIAAVFPHRLLPKHEGAGFYLEVAPRHVWYGGGIYMPSSAQLYQLREHIAAHHRRLGRLVGAAAFRRTFGSLEGEQLQRTPRGYRTRPPGGGVPEVPAVSRVLRASRGVRDGSRLLSDAARGVPGARPARGLPQRTARRRPAVRGAGAHVDRRRQVAWAGLLALAVTAVTTAQVRLGDESDQDAFRSWFTFLADAQFYRPTADVTDCAGLVRHAAREALKAHTPEWHRLAALPEAAPFPDVRERPRGSGARLAAVRGRARALRGVRRRPHHRDAQHARHRQGRRLGAARGSPLLPPGRAAGARPPDGLSRTVEVRGGRAGLGRLSHRPHRPGAGRDAQGTAR